MVRLRPTCCRTGPVETMTDVPTGVADERCGGCPLATSRRTFLRDAALTVVATLAATGLLPGAALAGLVSETRPLRTAGPLRLYTVPSSDAVMIDSENDVILTRSRGKVYAFSRRCPHKGARLVWRESEDRIFCPKHKARFTADGDHASGRRSRNLDRYGIRLEGRQIIVDVDNVYREDDDPAAWRVAVVAVS